MQAPSAPQACHGSTRATFAAGAALALAALGAYRNSFGVPFVFDDTAAIVNNASIRNFATAWWPPLNSTVSGRPVLNLSLALNYAISGTAVWSYHALNLAIHVLAGLTLFGIMRRTPASGPGSAGRTDPFPPLLAFCVALLWTLHPLQTESVTYIVQRAESLMGLFYLLTLYCFIRGVAANDQDTRQFEQGGRRPPGGGRGPGQADRRPEVGGHLVWFPLSILVCLLGMGTKEVMVSAPVIVFLYDRTFLAGTFRDAWRLRWRLYAALAATWLVLPFLVISTHGRNGTAGFGSGVSWGRYALTQFPAILRYLKLSVWPHPLVFDYGTEWVADFRAIWPQAMVVIGLAAVTIWIFFRPTSASVKVRLRPGYGGQALGFAGGWFFAILAPTSLIPGNRQTAAEHRMYLALIPVIAIGVIGIQRRLGRGALPCCLVVAGVLFAITSRRNGDYRSAVNLWADTVAKQPENAFAQDNLGLALYEAGQHPAAIARYKEAVRLKPDLAEAHNNLGVSWYHEGRLPEAISEYETVLRLEPDSPEACTNLGLALGDSGRMPEAIAQCERALRLKPDLPMGQNNLGVVLAKAGRLPEAVAHLREAVRLESGFVDAHNNLGLALALDGRLSEAIPEYEEALRLNPEFAAAHLNLGHALKTLGRDREARIQLAQASALGLSP